MITRSRLPLLFVIVLVAGAWPASGQECFTGVAPYAGPDQLPSRRPGPLAADGAGRLAVVGVTGENPWSLSIGIFSTDLRRLTAEVPLGIQARPGTVRILWSGEEWGLFYRDAGAVLRLQRISAAGVPIGGPITLLGTEPTGFDADYDVERAPEGWILARTVSAVGSSSIRLSLVSPEGSILRTTSIGTQPAEPGSIDVEPVDGGYAVVWDRDTGIFTDTFLALVDEQLGNPVARVLSVTGSEGELEWDGSYLILLSKVRPTVGATHIWGAILTRTGDLVSEQELLVPRAQETEPVEFGFSGREFVLLYHDVSAPDEPKFLRILQFIRSGETLVILNDVWFAADPFRNIYESIGGIAWTGASWVGGISRRSSPTQGYDSWLSSVCPLEAVIHGPSLAGRLLPVEFEAEAFGGRPPYTYTWTFGDHSPPGSGPRVTHTFVQEGLYEVVLTVRDAQGNTFVATRRVDVVTLIPTLVLTLPAPDRDLTVGETIELAASVSGGTPPIRVTWTLGDGRTAEGTSIAASWSAPGAWMVRATATDAVGQVATATVTIQVRPVRSRPVRRD